MDYKLVPNEYGLKWLKFSWRIVKKHYIQYTLLSFVIMVGSLLTYITPYVGIIAYGFLAPLVLAGICLFTKDTIEKGHSDLNQVWQVFKDEKLVERFLPYCLMQVAYGVLTYAVTLFTKSSPLIGPLISLTLSLIYICFTWFLAPLLLFTNKNIFECMILTQKGITHNIIPFTFHGLWGLLILFITGVFTCGLGILLVYLPISFAAQYVAYSSVFGVDVMADLKEEQLTLF